jgi:hypothetical protein
MQVSELRDAKPLKLTDAGDAWDKLAEGFGKHVTDCGQYFQKWLGGHSWQGVAAESASDKLSRMVKYLGVAKQELESVGKVLRAAGERFTLAQDQLKKVLADAEGAHYKVQDDGSVTAPTFSTAGMTGGEIGVKQRDQQSAAQGYADRIGAALSAAEKADKEFAQTVKVFTDAAKRCAKGDWSAPLMDLMAANSASGELLKELGMPGEKAKPADVKAWWDGLSASLQAELMQDYPEELGNRDGIPAADRDKINRSHLPTLLNQLEQDYKNAGGDDTALKNKIESLKAIQGQLDQQGPPRTYLLGISTDGNGRAIIAKGNPDTAEHQAVYVPGTTTNLGTIGGDERMADLWSQAKAENPRASVSTITWLGYDAPQDIVKDSPFEHYAYDGAPAYRQFMDGLDATHSGSGEPHRTAIGHSYGSTLVGAAAQTGNLNADDVIFAGSPGVKVGSADEMDVPKGHVWNELADHDNVANIGQFGHGGIKWDWLNTRTFVDPSNDVFGANQMNTDTEGRGPGATRGAEGHSEYWNKDTTALKNQALVVVGNYGYVTAPQ